MKHLRAKLTYAYQEGRRIWLVTDRDFPTVEDVPDSDGLPPMHPATSTSIRHNQVLKYLKSLYGSPDEHAVQVDNRDGWEILASSLRQGRARVGAWID